MYIMKALRSEACNSVRQYAEVFGNSTCGTLNILTLDDPSFTSLGLKDRHNNAAPGSSPVLILFPVGQMVMCT